MALPIVLQNNLRPTINCSPGDIKDSGGSTIMKSASVVSRCCSFAFDSNNSHFVKTNPGFSRNLSLVLMWRRPSQRILSCRRRSSLMTPVLEDQKEEEEEEAAGKSVESVALAKEGLPKVDRSGRFCSPRAGRELALSILYAACLDGSDPVRLLEKRMNMRREPGYEFDKASLLEYNHMSFGGSPVTAETAEEADKLSQIDEKETAIEAEVLSAPPKLVYSKLILRFTRKLLLAVVDRWDNDVLVIEKVAPPNWKNAPAGKIIEFCILHLAMSEIAVLGTRHQIVINEVVDLAKRFCDGAAPRIINGCLRSFIKDFQGGHSAETVESEKQVAVNA